MNPTDKHKTQAREIVETPFGPFPTRVDQSPDEYAGEWRELLIDRIATALSAKDAETRSSLAQKILNTVAAQEPPDSALTLPRYEGYEQALKDVDIALRDLFQKEEVK